MISITNRPAGVNEWTVPINALKDASIDERMEFYRAHPDIVAEAREKHPDAFSTFVDKYGHEFADKLIASVERAS